PRTRAGGDRSAWVLYGPRHHGRPRGNTGSRVPLRSSPDRSFPTLLRVCRRTPSLAGATLIMSGAPPGPEVLRTYRMHHLAGAPAPPWAGRAGRDEQGIATRCLNPLMSHHLEP